MAARIPKGGADRAAWRGRILRRAERGRAGVSETCREAGISRTAFYRWRARARAEGPAGLIDRSRRPRGHPRTTPAEIVAKIVLLRSMYEWGPARIADFLEREHGIRLSGPGIWKILARLGLNRGGRRGRPRSGGEPGPAFHDLDVSVMDFRLAEAPAGARPLYLYFAADIAAGVTVVRAYDRCDARIAVDFLSYALGWLPFKPHAVRTEPGEEFGGPFRDFLLWHGIRPVAGRPLGALPLEIGSAGFDRLRRGMILSGNADILDKISAWETRAHLQAPSGVRAAPFARLTGTAGSAGPRSR